MLKKLGFGHVDIANNGVEALELFECGKYALVLMDMYIFINQIIPMLVAVAWCLSIG